MPMTRAITLATLLACYALANTSQATIVVGNAGFETVVPIPYWPVASYGVWTGNPATIVTAENGITPVEGTHMLKFTGGDPTANVWQLVDVSAVPSGSLVTLSAEFNRVDS